MSAAATTAGATDAGALLRPGLLDGTSLLLAGPPAPLGSAIAAAFRELGARVSSCLPDGEDEASIDAAVVAARAELGAIDMLVVDGAGLFGAGLTASLGAAWNVTRAVVNHAFVPDGRGGRVVYLAPPANAGARAPAARAALENLARTLAVEWARHSVNTVAVAPGPSTPAAQLAALVAYLASPAGAYFSGCLLDLGTVRAR